MVISSKERDQSKEQGGEKRDPALTVKTKHHRSQLNPDSKLLHLSDEGIRGTTGRAIPGTKA